ncbi:type III secretion protein C [Endobacter medicaginis]|uniref:Type III secretion protein C n=1 Tax=Endobacter medicaginis TaxID=1181271 RepID=A0A839V3A8_9PROT|nr:hypothetical protein [Endobacter medicaginis]MBB3175263.1 type III secretion protein C [Endobacter medicaginis]MCX5476603.1 hypothetical protein [Endobacter medicaginis]NVN31303.1 hypothetical protein [Endobacter medicaginis]
MAKIFAILVLPCGPVAASAADDGVAGRQAWKHQPYPYTVVSQGVAAALRDFGYNLGLRVMIAPDVGGTIDGRLPPGDAQNFLEAVTHGNDLDWYFDGAVLYVSKTSSEQTAVIPLHGHSFDEVKKSLEQDGILDARFRLTKQAAGDAVVVAGPPSFIAVMRQAIEAQTSDTSPQGGHSGMAVLRGSVSSISGTP